MHTSPEPGFLKPTFPLPGPQIEPLSGLLEGGTQVTIWGSNLGQKAEDVLHTVRVVRVPCTVIPSLYQISTR